MKPKWKKSSETKRKKKKTKTIPMAAKNDVQCALWFDVLRSMEFHLFLWLLSMSYLLKCFLYKALIQYNAIGLEQLFANERQNPTIRKTCQKALYSSAEFSLLESHNQRQRSQFPCVQKYFRATIDDVPVNRIAYRCRRDEEVHEKRRKKRNELEKVKTTKAKSKC